MPRAFISVLLCASLMTLPLTAHADIIGPPGDPAHQEKITGIASADSGFALMAGGIVMLSLQATQSYDVPTKNDLILAGGLCTAFGAGALVVGTLIWLLARRKTAEWQSTQSASARIRPGAGGLAVAF